MSYFCTYDYRQVTSLIKSLLLILYCIRSGSPLSDIGFPPSLKPLGVMHAGRVLSIPHTRHIRESSNQIVLIMVVNVIKLLLGNRKLQFVDILPTAGMWDYIAHIYVTRCSCELPFTVNLWEIQIIVISKFFHFFFLFLKSLNNRSAC